MHVLVRRNPVRESWRNPAKSSCATSAATRACSGRACARRAARATRCKRVSVAARAKPERRALAAASGEPQRLSQVAERDEPRIADRDGRARSGARRRPGARLGHAAGRRSGHWQVNDAAAGGRRAQPRDADAVRDGRGIAAAGESARTSTRAGGRHAAAARGDLRRHDHRARAQYRARACSSSTPSRRCSPPKWNPRRDRPRRCASPRRRWCASPNRRACRCCSSAT